MILDEDIESTNHTQSKNHTDPEENVIYERPSFDPLTPLNHDKWHLKHHHKEAISPQLLSDTSHHKLMRQRRDQKRDKRRKSPTHVILTRKVDVPAKEVVDRYVPLSTKFKPVTGVPPVRVKVSIRKACYLCKGAENVFEYHQENQQERDHEWEEEARDGLC